MISSTRTRWPLLWVSAGLAMAAGCSGATGLDRPPARTEPYHAEAKIIIAGYSWDPEALQYSFGMCGAACPQRPVVSPGQLHYERSLVLTADVQLVDRSGGGIAYRTGSTDAGLWRFENVVREPQRPYYTLASKTPADGGFAGPVGPIPQATTYFPTLAISPGILPGTSQCLGRPAPVIGNTGILDAVARHLTNMGTRTTAADLLRPSKYGGVIIWWAYGAAGGVTTRQGADGALLKATAGEVIPVQWGCPSNAVCPPGAPFPPAGMTSKSPRNFYVLPGATTSNIGVSVILLPPAAVPPTVSFTLTDPVTDATQNRPFTFSALPSVTAVPGKVLFGETQAWGGTAWEPAPYECSEYARIPGTGAITFVPPPAATNPGGPVDAGGVEDAGEVVAATHESCGMCHVAGDGPIR